MWLAGNAPPPELPPTGLTGGLTDPVDAFTARWRSTSLTEGFLNAQDVRARREVEADLVEQVRARVDPAEVRRIQTESNRASATPGGGMLGDAAVLEAARQAAARDPEAWADVDLSPEGVERAAMDRLRTEFEGLQRDMEGAPQSAFRDFVADLGASTLSLKTAPFLIVGAGTGGAGLTVGSLLRVAGTEAGINVGLEVTLMPAQYDAAEVLNLPEPDVLAEIQTAAVFGAVFGAGAEGAMAAGRALRRGLTYAADRVTPAVSGASPTQVDVGIERTVAAVNEGADPVEAVREMARDMTPEPPPPQPGRQPLVLRQDQRVRTATDEDVAAAEAALREAQAADTSRATSPLLDQLTLRGRQLDPQGEAAQELFARGFRRQGRLRMFRRGGQRDIDTLVATEWEELLPGIRDATGTGMDADFLNREGVLDLIMRAERGEYDWLRPRADVRAAEQALEDITRARDVGVPWEDFASGQAAPDGFFVDLDRYEFDTPNPFEVRANIGRDFDEWFSETYPGLRLLASERDEIVTELSRRGGDAEFLVDRMLERELDFADLSPDEVAAYDAPPFDEAPAQGVPGARGEGAGRPGQDGGAARGGAAREGGGPQSEATAAGDQFLLDGVAPIGQRDRLDARASARLDGGARGADSEIGGLFDPGDKVRSDLFDDPHGPEARDTQKSIASDLRAQIEAEGDFAVEFDAEGRPARMASAVLDEMDAEDASLARMMLCGRGNIE